MYSDIVLDLVDNSDKNCVTLSCTECWPWKLAIDNHSGLARAHLGEVHCHYLKSLHAQLT